MTNDRPMSKHGKPLCGAKTRNGGKCRQPPLANGRCRLHGGKASFGKANGRYVDGRYSKYLPTKLQSRFAEAFADPALLELKPEIALIDGRMSELLETLNDKASVDFGELWGAYKTAVNRGEQKRVDQMIVQIDDALANGRDRERTWNQLGEQIDRRMRLVESERKRLVQLQEFVAAEQMRHFIIRIQQLIEENVTDRGALINITNGLYALTNAS